MTFYSALDAIRPTVIANWMHESAFRCLGQSNATRNVRSDLAPEIELFLMRVIAGKYRSRPLQSIKGADIRPTADRLRETLFNVLCGGNPEALSRTTWIDLFAGTGAVGIEALSRGAEQVTFVETSPDATRLIERNLKYLNVDKGYQVLRLEVSKALRLLAAVPRPVDFIFLDPPYSEHAAYSRTLVALSGSQLLKEGGRVIVEHDRKFDPGDVFGPLRRYRKLEQGDSALSFYGLAGQS